MNALNEELKAKRKRSANWDILEKSLLKSCIAEYVSVTKNKNTDTNTNKNKTIAWQKLLISFNELNSRERNLGEIKQQWRTMKLDAKKNLSDVKSAIKCTGGGPKPPSPEPETIEILSLIPQEFETDCNVFDSDSILLQEVKSPVTILTQDYVLTPVNNKENEEELKIEPKHIYKHHEKKRILSFQEMKDSDHKTKLEEREMIKQRTNVLKKCLKEEHELKMKNMVEKS